MVLHWKTHNTTAAILVVAVILASNAFRVATVGSNFSIYARNTSLSFNPDLSWTIDPDLATVRQYPVGLD